MTALPNKHCTLHTARRSERPRRSRERNVTGTFRCMHGRRFLFNIGGTIDRGAEVAEVERRRRENRGAEGDGVCGWGFPLPTRVGVWGGVSAGGRKLFDCGSQNGEF